MIGVGFISRVLMRNMDFLLPQFEAEARLDHADEFEKYEMDSVLPPMPCALSRLPVTATRSFISHGLQILTDVTDTKLMYSERPVWWPINIPFCKPFPVPSSYISKYGANASKAWHTALKIVVYEMHKSTNQDYRKNVCKSGWTAFTNK